jgi:hypothetical protein
MVTIQCLPRLQYSTETCDTRQAVPMLSHPPLLTNVAKTSFALFLGHITVSGKSRKSACITIVAFQSEGKTYPREG